MHEKFPKRLTHVTTHDGDETDDKEPEIFFVSDRENYDKKEYHQLEVFLGLPDGGCRTVGYENRETYHQEKGDESTHNRVVIVAFAAPKKQSDQKAYHIDAFNAKITQPRPVFEWPENKKKEVAQRSPEHGVGSFDLAQQCL